MFANALYGSTVAYTVDAGAILTSLYPELFYYTNCEAHILHNCAMKVISHFEDVDQLIAKVKSPTS